jgi:hypothetical protein
MTTVLTLSASGKIEEQNVSLGSSITGTAIVDFGNENNSATITVMNAILTNIDIKSISFLPQDTSETSLEDFSLNGVTFSVQNIIDNVSFDIVGTATNEASGNYTVKYLITY